MAHFIKGSKIYFDTETTGLYPWRGDRPFAFSFYNRDGESAYFEFEVEPFTRMPIIDFKAVAMMAEILEDQKIEKVGHNIKFDIRMMEEAFGIQTRGRIHDTGFKAHACNTLELNYGLKQLSDKYAGIPQTDQKLLQQNTVRMRRKASKLGWKIGYEIKPQPHGPPKKKATVAADYWLGNTMYKRGVEGVTEQDAGYCKYYAVEDAHRTMLLDVLYDDLMVELGADRIYYEMEEKLWPVIYEMETRGVVVDPDLVEQQIKKAIEKIDEMVPILVSNAWPDFNPNSDRQVKRLVIDVLKMPVDKYTEKGNPSIGREWMQEHLDHPVIYTLAKYRSGIKAFGSFFSRYNALMVPDRISEGKFSIHANFQQTGAATGRLSCRDPNMQNVMDPTVSFSLDPMHVRNVFIPRPGYKWLCVDYSNMEVRVFASVAGEPTMLQAFNEGKDVHSAVANRIWGGEGNPLGMKQAIRALQLDGTGVGTSPEVAALWREWKITDPLKLTHSYIEGLATEWLRRFEFQIVEAQDSLKRRYARNIGKMVTFLKIYGGGMKGARKLLKMPDGEIREILAEYDRNHPRIVEFADELCDLAAAEGCVWSLWGRRLAIDAGFVYRAVNYLVQGSSADLMKSSMIRCYEYIKNGGYDAHILLTVHDELIFEVASCDLTCQFIRDICNIMSDSEGRITIPMPVEPKIVVKDWSQKRKITNLQLEIK